jgi:effector-binding domain-containing protein
MSEQPQVEHRKEERYVGIPATVTMEQISDAIGRGFQELFEWLGSRSAVPTGPPFVRYLRVDMNSLLEIELAAPADVEPGGDQRVRSGVLPSGRYVTLRHVGPYDGLVTANANLQEWASAQNLTFQIDGSIWRGRIERYLTDPSQEPDPSRWQTEIAYLVNDA